MAEENQAIDTEVVAEQVDGMLRHIEQLSPGELVAISVAAAMVFLQRAERRAITMAPGREDSAGRQRVVLARFVNDMAQLAADGKGGGKGDGPEEVEI